MPSSRFRKMKASVGELRRHLLPKTIEPTGSYAWQDKVERRAEAFRMLVHAEIEAYLEDRAEEIASSAWNAWCAERKVSVVTVHLLGFSGREMYGPVKTIDAPTDNKKKAWPEKKYLDDRLSRSVTGFIHFLRTENHGIREANLLSIVIPLGIEVDKIDGDLIFGLEELGQLRGRVAHTSLIARASDGVDPKGELDRIRLLLGKVSVLDVQLDSLLDEAKC